MRYIRERLILGCIIAIISIPFAICNSCRKDNACWECTVGLFGSQQPYQKTFCQKDEPKSYIDENGNDRAVYNCKK